MIMSNMKDKLGDAAKAVTDTAKNVGHKIADGVGQAAEFVKEKVGMNSASSTELNNIQPHMDVVASCGKTVGKVDHMEGCAIKLTKNDSPDGMHHFVPTNWVSKVDQHVHLNKNSVETETGWKNDAAACSRA